MLAGGLLAAAALTACLPPPPPPPPPPPAPAAPAPVAPGAFPNTATTGPTVGLSASGSLTLTSAGAVYSGLDISGPVIIKANNVTLRQSRVRVSGPSATAVTVAQGVTGTVLEDCELDGQGRSFTGVQGAAVTDNAGHWGAGPITVRRCEIHGFEHGIEPSWGSVITDSLIHQLKAFYPDGTTPHYDGIASWGSANVTVTHNAIIAPSDQTSAINLTNDFGSISNWVITNNYLAGGGYALNVRGDSSLGGAAGRPVTGIVVSGNRFGPSGFGHVVIIGAGVTGSGNVDDVTGRPVTL